MDSTLESITGLVGHDELEVFLRGAITTFGGLWDVEQVVGEVVPMADAHVGAGALVRVTVAAYPEHRLFVRLDDDATASVVQEWEYLPVAP